MNTRQRTSVMAALALVVSAASTPQLNAATLHDNRPVLVTGRPPPELGPGTSPNCPTCYKGYDFGRDCFQYVWTGFEEVWVNVCLWGWQ